MSTDPNISLGHHCRHRRCCRRRRPHRALSSAYGGAQAPNSQRSWYCTTSPLLYTFLSPFFVPAPFPIIRVPPDPALFVEHLYEESKLRKSGLFQVLALGQHRPPLHWERPEQRIL